MAAVAVGGCQTGGTSSGLDELNELGVATGVCERVQIGDEDFTSRCEDKVATSAYDDGRLGFHFTFDNGGIISFSGYDRPNPTPDTDLTSLDRVIFGLAGAAREFPVTGSCRYGNFYAGHREIRCEGRTDDGASFSAVFRMTEPPTGQAI